MLRSRTVRAASLLTDPAAGARAGAGAAFAGVAALLLAFFLVPLAVDAWSLPVGADVPYYLWSTRLAGDAGLSVTDFRPGLHALLLLVSGASGLSVLQVAGAVAVALAVSAGLAATALAERGLGRDPVRSAAIGIATGAYTARLASGFLANLLFAAIFLAAAALLVGPRRAGRRDVPALAAGLLGAAGLAHGLFLAVGAAVLGGAAVLRLLSAREDRARARSDLARLGTAAVGGAAIAGAGFVAASLGRPLSEDERAHTRDALVQRAGLGAVVGEAYRARWREAVTAFRLPVSLPLAAVGGAALHLGRRGVDALFGSLVASWTATTLAGVVLGLSTSRLPAGRVLNFALVLPMLGGLGAVALGRWVGARRPVLGGALGLGLVVALAAGPFVAWTGTHPFMSKPDLEAAGAAAHAADDLPPRTPLVYVIDHHGPHAGFELSRFVNVIRVSLPADRSDDVRIFVGSPEDYEAGRPGFTGDEEHDGIAREAFARLGATLEEPHAAYLVRTFNQVGWDEGVGTPLGALVRVLETPPASRFPVGQVAPDNRGLPPVWLPFLTLALLGGLGLAGAGWIAWLGPGTDAAARALAPTVGAASLVLFGVAFDALGLRLASWGGIAGLVAIAAGFIAWRRARRGAAEAPAG